jgi:plasmid stabilization system protein ParE
LAQRNPAGADTLIREIDRKFEQLSRFPFIGRERASLSRGLRSVLVRTLLVFYLVGPDQITVVWVIDGRMDVDEELLR